jgi:hypothetical protein
MTNKESIARARAAVENVPEGQGSEIIEDTRKILKTLDEAVSLLQEINDEDECRITPDHSERHGFTRRSCLEHDVEAPGGICPYSKIKKFLEEME